MLITDPPGIDPGSLRDRMDGRVSAPGDLDWDEARQAWNLTVDQRPAAVAIPHQAAAVAAIVEFAQGRGRPGGPLPRQPRHRRRLSRRG